MKNRVVVARQSMALRVLCAPNASPVASDEGEGTVIVIPHMKIVVLDNVLYQQIDETCWANVVEGESDDYVTDEEPDTLRLLNGLLTEGLV